MTPIELHAALTRTLAILEQQRVADPYGFAFGPRQPFDGYRPSPFGVPSGPPAGYGQHWSGPRLDTTGWGSSGWDFGKGASQQPGLLPLGAGHPGIRPQPPVRGLINPVLPPNRPVTIARQQPLPFGLGLFHGWGTAVAPGAGLNSENWNPVQGLQNYRIQTRPPSNL